MENMGTYGKIWETSGPPWNMGYGKMLNLWRIYGKCWENIGGKKNEFVKHICETCSKIYWNFFCQIWESVENSSANYDMEFKKNTNGSTWLNWKPVICLFTSTVVAVISNQTMFWILKVFWGWCSRQETHNLHNHLDCRESSQPRIFVLLGGSIWLFENTREE